MNCSGWICGRWKPHSFRENAQTVQKQLQLSWRLSPSSFSGFLTTRTTMKTRWVRLRTIGSDMRVCYLKKLYKKKEKAARGEPENTNLNNQKCSNRITNIQKIFLPSIGAQTLLMFTLVGTRSDNHQIRRAHTFNFETCKTHLWASQELIFGLDPHRYFVMKITWQLVADTPAEMQNLVWLKSSIQKCAQVTRKCGKLRRLMPRWPSL